MARPTEGFSTRPHPVTGIHQVRFTHEGSQREFSTGERDPRLAHVEAARIYAEVISGRWIPGKKGLRPGTPLGPLVALWVERIEKTLDEKTVPQYAMYAKTHWSPFFVTIDRLTTASIADYTRKRLGEVQRSTVKKERSALRGFLLFAEEEGLEHVEFPPLPKGKPGTVASAHAKKHVVELEFDQVEKAIAALPEWSKGKGRAHPPFPVRARFVVAYETGLRPATLDELAAPGDYRKGARRLRIRDEIDKARFGRSVPLTARARRALDSVVTADGLIFGCHDYREYLKPAGRAAGLTGDDAKHFSPYDLRHARGTHLTESSGGNLTGVAYLFGHRRVTTTARYIHPSQKAAERVLSSAPKTRPKRASS